MRTTRFVVWSGLSCLLVSSLVACTAATSPSDPAEAEAERESSAITMQPPSPASTIVPAVGTTQPKRCITPPKTYNGYGYGCPGPQHAAAALCSLDPQFDGGFSLSFDCQETPGSNGLYTYTLTYECTRPQPCR